MPHETTWENRGVCWTFSGVVTLKEVHDADAEMYGDPRFDALKYYIWDGTHIEKIDYAETEADQPAAFDKASSSYKPNLKGALVAKDEYVRKIIERYITTSSSLRTTWELKLFDSIVDARNWVSAQ